MKQNIIFFPPFRQGIKSCKGEKGDKGNTGASGPMGPAGPQGARGFTGEPGESATVNVKGTNTIPWNQPASVVNDGIQPHAWLTFNIPQGVLSLINSRGTPMVLTATNNNKYNITITQL